MVREFFAKGNKNLRWSVFCMLYVVLTLFWLGSINEDTNRLRIFGKIVLSVVAIFGAIGYWRKWQQEKAARLDDTAGHSNETAA